MFTKRSLTFIKQQHLHVFIFSQPNQTFISIIHQHSSQSSINIHLNHPSTFISIIHQHSSQSSINIHLNHLTQSIIFIQSKAGLGNITRQMTSSLSLPKPFIRPNECLGAWAPYFQIQKRHSTESGTMAYVTNCYT